MGFTPGGWRFRRQRPRVLLICPQCGQETPENVDKLRDISFYRCRGDDCDYLFELAAPENYSMREIE